MPPTVDAPVLWQHLPADTPRGGGSGSATSTPRVLALGSGFGEVGAGTTVQAGPDEDEFNVR